MGKIAAIRIRGTVNVEKTIKDTLTMLRLEHPHHCVVIDDRESYRGMLQKVKDYVTFGEIDKETFTNLLLKWGRTPGDERIDKTYIKKKTGKSVTTFVNKFFKSEVDLDELGIKKVFRLHPPRKGYKGIRLGYNQGGSLGYRGEKMVFLLKRII